MFCTGGAANIHVKGFICIKSKDRISGVVPVSLARTPGAWGMVGKVTSGGRGFFCDAKMQMKTIILSGL